MRCSIFLLFAVVVGGCGGSPFTESVSGGDASADSGAGADGGIASSDGATRGDAGAASPDAGGVACGPTTCAAHDVCCVTPSGGSFAFACGAVGSCAGATGGGSPGTALQCADSAGCAAGAVCCIEMVNGRAASDCRVSCANGAALCDPNAMPSSCPPSAPCSSTNIGDWGLPASYGTCGGKGP